MRAVLDELHATAGNAVTEGVYVYVCVLCHALSRFRLLMTHPLDLCLLMCVC